MLEYSSNKTTRSPRNLACEQALFRGGWARPPTPKESLLAGYKKSCKFGKVVVGITGATALGIVLVNVPFVTQALR